MTDWKLSFAHGNVMGKKETKLTITDLLFFCANTHLNGHSFKIVIASTVDHYLKPFSVLVWTQKHTSDD